MPHKTKPGIGEQVMSFEGGLPDYELGIDWEKRITFGRLLDAVSATEPNLQSMGSITEADLELIDPAGIQAALVVGEKDDGEVDNAYHGLVLPPADYGVIVTSPRMLVKRARSRTERAREPFSEPDSVEAAKNRTAVKILEAALPSMKARRQALDAEADIIQPVVSEARAHWRAHYLAKNLYPKVIDTKGLIEAMIKVAGNRMKWTVDEHTLAKQALTVQLLGLRADGNRRASNWVRYGSDALRYNTRRNLVIRDSQNAVERELKKYQPVPGLTKEDEAT